MRLFCIVALHVTADILWRFYIAGNNKIHLGLHVKCPTFVLDFTQSLPGHQGIPGNEEADRLAKEGAVEVPPDQFAAIPFSVGKNVIKKYWNRGTGTGGLPVLGIGNPKC
jgi:hypothetical protein